MAIIKRKPDFLIWSLLITESSVEVEPAALVGVYETDDQRLLLNAAGDIRCFRALATRHPLQASTAPGW